MTDLLTRAHEQAVAGAASPADAHATLAGSVAETLTLAVASSTGRFRPVAELGQRGATGSWVRAGQLLGHVTGGRGRADEVRSPSDARLCALLVRAGQLVSRGQGLVWLCREEVAA
jgi:biotin carboxyl carrier protein